MSTVFLNLCAFETLWYSAAKSIISLRYGRMCNKDFVANFALSIAVKEF